MKLIFNEAQIRTTTDELTFSINKMMSRTPSIVYFKFYGYTIRDVLISEYKSNKWVVTTQYNAYSEKFDAVTLEGYDYTDLDHFVIELYLIGITSENPLYFNQVQLNEGDLKPYHTPNYDRNQDGEKIEVGFFNSLYVNLYDSSNNFLQIIRPSKETFSNQELTPSQCTILAPHLENESEFDNPIALLYEYIYQIEQVIGVEK